MIPTLAIIPARGESKGISGQHLRPFLGRPLLVHSIDHARNATGVTRTVVCTNDPAAARVALAAGVDVIDAPVGGAAAEPSDDIVLEHVVGLLRARGERFQRAVILEIEKPLRRDGEVDLALKTFDREGADSLVSVCEVEGRAWTREPDGRAVSHVDRESSPRFRENGSLKIVGVEGFERHRCLVFGRVALHEMPAVPWLRLESLMWAKSEPATKGVAGEVLRRVKLVVFDFDGVMTDNRVLVLQDGTEGASCDRSDGLGVGMLKAAGMPMLVLSKEQNPVVGARCRKLGLECHQGIDDKLTKLRDLLASRGMTMADIAYVGNDINDLACMREAGLPIAVADAYPPVLAAAKMVTVKPGGKGAVREVCDALLEARRDPA